MRWPLRLDVADAPEGRLLDVTRPRRVPRIDLAARVRERTAAADEWRNGDLVEDDAKYWADLQSSMREEGDLDWLDQPTERVPALVSDQAAASEQPPTAIVLPLRRHEVPLTVDLSPEAQSLQAFVDARLAGARPVEAATPPRSPEADSLQAFVDERLAGRAGAPAVAPAPAAEPASDLSDFAKDLVRRAQSPGEPAPTTVSGPAAAARVRSERRSPRPLPELLSMPDAPPGAPRQSTSDLG
jgi:hypothetical protein